MLENFTTYIEQKLPINWNANAVTLVGNIALYIAGIVAIF